MAPATSTGPSNPLDRLQGIRVVNSKYSTRTSGYCANVAARRPRTERSTEFALLD